jgi:hypothetical protein
LLPDSSGEGIPADGGAINVSTRRFTVPFVFPSGRACNNFNELARACHEDAAAAAALLHKGYLESFLVAQGRTDLAGAARAAARVANRERALDDFLGRLPASVLTAARLRVEPAVIDLGTLRCGEDRRCELVLVNEGMRLLYGSASCDSPWLSLGDGPTQTRKLFQFSGRTALPLRVLGVGLRAYRKPQEAEVRFESNGGSATVVVRLTVPVQPFPTGALAGAASPRQMAEKAQQAPREAAALIESGAVARWYAANGWVYPVTAPTASGVAAVQQLFEALGLAKPPRVELGEDAVVLSGSPGATVDYVISVVTAENRAVVAHGSSDQPWLEVGPTVFRGRSAFLPLKVFAVPARLGDTLHATVSITANGGQRLVVPVTLAVGGAPPAAEFVHAPPAGPRQAPAAPAPAPPAVPAAAPLIAQPPPPGRGRSSVGWALLPAALLAVVVLGAVLRDCLAPVHSKEAPQREVDSVPRIAIYHHDQKKNDDLDKLWLTDLQPTMRFGVVTARHAKGAPAKRLTFDPWGRTNNTCLRLGGKDERLFGGPRGRWEEMAGKTWQDDQGHEHEGVKSVWVCDDTPVAVTQLVELVRGAQSRLLDTCRVSYQIQNRDRKERTVGLRFLLDTYIGGNDGVPFTIPGDSTLCDTFKELPDPKRPGAALPDFLQALEGPDLAHPGTVAHLRLKVEGLEAPARVTLGAWPNEKLRVLVRNHADGPLTLWDVPLLPLGSLDLNDSAVVLYWKEQPLGPGAKRAVGFEYGLWELAGRGGRLAATVDGAFRPGGELTVVAYVNRPAGGGAEETLTLTVPESFQLLQGAQAQRVPSRPGGGNVPVTWKVRAGPVGRYEFTVQSSAGPALTLPAEVKKSIFD